jgi:hypothetical protein
MKVTVEIPDALSADLGEGFADLGLAALEALAAEAYERDVLSLEQVRQMLGLSSRWEAQEVLSLHGVWPGTSLDEFKSDMATVAKVDAVG